MKVLQQVKIAISIGVILLTQACAQQLARPSVAEKLGIDPQADGNMRLAQASILGGDYQSAIRLYQRQIAKAPKNLTHHLKLAETLVNAGAYDEATQAYRKAIRVEPTSPAPWVGLGKISLRRAKPYEAFDHFLQASARDQQSSEALNGMAVSRDYQGRHKEAQTLYHQLLEQQPYDLQIKSNIGLSMALEGRSSQAIQYLLSFAATPNAPIQARHNLALAYALAGNSANAEDILRLDLGPSEVNSSKQYFEMIKSVMRCNRSNGCSFTQPFPAYQGPTSLQ